MNTLMGSLLAAAGAAWLALAPAAAEVTIGITLGTTGPTAGLGIPYRTVLEHMLNTIAGQKVRYVTLDDAGDPTNAVKNARKLITEEKADLILGSSSTPTCLALVDVAVENKIAQICFAPVTVPESKRPWIFSVPQQVPVMLSAVGADMKAKGVKSVAYIGYSDGWGDLCWQVLEKLAGEAGIKIVAHERYNRPDTSVTAQVLK